MIAELNVEHPALTRKPPAHDGMVVHEWVDTSMYLGHPAQDRYLAATNGTERKAALAEMPNATVKFIEVPKGEPFFLLEPLDEYPDFDDDQADDGQPAERTADPR